MMMNIDMTVGISSKWNVLGKNEILLQSNLGYPNAGYPKLLGYSKTMDSPDLFLYYLLQ